MPSKITKEVLVYNYINLFPKYKMYTISFSTFSKFLPINVYLLIFKFWYLYLIKTYYLILPVYSF